MEGGPSESFPLVGSRNPTLSATKYISMAQGILGTSYNLAQCNLIYFPNSANYIDLNLLNDTRCQFLFLKPLMRELHSPVSQQVPLSWNEVFLPQSNFQAIGIQCNVLPPASIMCCGLGLLSAASLLVLS